MQVLTPKTFRVNNYCVYGQTVGAIYQIDAIMLNRRLTHQKGTSVCFSKAKSPIMYRLQTKEKAVRIG